MSGCGCLEVYVGNDGMGYSCEFKIIILSHQLILLSCFPHCIVRQLIPKSAYDVSQDRKAKGQYHSAADTFPARFDN
jgi:hypothetical protein